MSRKTLRRLAQLVAVLVSCFLVPAFAQSAQGGSSRLAKIRITLHSPRSAAGHPGGGQSSVRSGNVQAKDGIPTCASTCDTEHGLCTCVLLPWDIEGSLECCALVCGDCHTADLEN